MKHCIRLVTLLAAALAAVAVSAQSPPVPARADPADPRASVPLLEYRPAFGKERPPPDEAVRSWRQSNDTVEKIGGWQAYLKEGRQAGTPAAASAKPEGGQPGHAPK
jgi:hypothetical protein